MATNTPMGSTGTGVVGVEIVGQMRGYLAGLVETGKLTKEQTQGMARDFSLMAKQVMAAQKTVVANAKLGVQAADEWAASLRKAGSAARTGSAGLMSFGRQVGDVATMAAMGAPPMQILASQAEQLAFSFKEAGGVAGILASPIGVIGAAAAGAAVQMGALYLAVQGYNADAIDAAEISKRVGDGMERLGVILGHTRDQTIRLRVATGELTEVQGDQLRASQQALDRLNASTEATRARLNEIAKAHDSVTTQMVDRVEAVVPAWTPLGAAIDYATTSSYELEVEQGQLNTVIDRGIALTRESVGVEHEAIAAEQEAKDSKKESTAARREHKKAIDEEAQALRILRAAQGDISGDAAKRANDYNNAIEQLRRLTEASTLAAASEMERIDIAERAAKAQAGAALVDASFLGSKDSRIEAQRAFQDAVTAIEAEAETKRAELRDKARKKEAEEQKKALDLQMRLADQAFGMVEDIAGKVSAGMGDAYAAATDNLAQMEAYQNAVESHLTDTQKEELAQRVKAQKDAARRAFETYKAAQLAQAGIGALSAFVAALDDAPYPANLAIAALSAGAAAAPIAAIAAEQPSFHSGGAIGNMAPDEVSIRAQAGEFVASKQGRSVLGDGVLQKANAGVTPDTSSVYLVNAYRHTRETSRYEADRLARNGPYARAIRGSSLPGMR